MLSYLFHPLSLTNIISKYEIVQPVRNTKDKPLNHTIFTLLHHHKQCP